MKAFIATVVAVVSLLSIPAGALAVPQPARQPKPPAVTGKSGLTIPWHSCYSASRFIEVKTFGRSQIDDWNITVRKSGVSVPLGQNRICGYMGSGHYTLVINYLWSYRVKYRETVEVYGPNPSITRDEYGGEFVKLSFTCDQKRQLASTSVELGQHGYFYACKAMAPNDNVDLDELFYWLDEFEAGLNPEIVFLPALDVSERVPLGMDIALIGPSSIPLPQSFEGSTTQDRARLDLAGIDIDDRVVVGEKIVESWDWSKPKAGRAKVSIAVYVR